MASSTTEQVVWVVRRPQPLGPGIDGRIHRSEPIGIHEVPRCSPGRGVALGDGCSVVCDGRADPVAGDVVGEFPLVGSDAHRFVVGNGQHAMCCPVPRLGCGVGCSTAPAVIVGKDQSGCQREPDAVEVWGPSER